MIKSFRKESPTFHIGLTGTLSRKALRKTLRNSGLNLSPEQIAILNFLLENDKSSMQELSERSYRDNSTTTRIIDNLEKNNYVIRTNDPNDRRLNRIMITESGKDVIQKANEIAKNYIISVNHGLSEDEIKSMIITLQKIKSNIIKVLDNNE
jgi:DNA-binding MarR family transcriptional regulator